MLERSGDWRSKYLLARARDGYMLLRCEFAVFKPEAPSVNNPWKSEVKVNT